MRDVINGVYAESTHGPMQAKMRTNRMFLACWDLPLIPYTVDVVYALGAALKWRKYRSAADYLYLSKLVAEREGRYSQLQQRTRPLQALRRACTGDHARPARISQAVGAGRTMEASQLADIGLLVDDQGDRVLQRRTPLDHLQHRAAHRVVVASRLQDRRGSAGPNHHARLLLRIPQPPSGALASMPVSLVP